MIYLPWKWHLGPKPVDIVLIDECQDLSAAVLDLALKCAKPDGGRLIFVGDRAQAIYGFAGADDQAFDRIVERTQATQLPLSICYRCLASHVELAKAIVPQIEARPDAPEGIVEHISEDDLIERLRGLRGLPGQALVVCRVTAPLIALCIRLIGQQINARVRGREIGEQLIELLEAVLDMPGARYEQFGDWLATYEQLQVERLRQRPAEDAEPLIQALTDRAAAVRVCYEAFGMPTAGALKEKMRALFSKEKPDVWLSTVHKAKG
ncbi:MAG: UvrD-helicase domain-containing protein [Ktedonobacterales bacterium]|nr:UvrD-helicase domain-containing protein [Ktedonobacterales bacterium]